MRDTYDLGDKLVIVTTDRQSAFDRLLAAIPFKASYCTDVLQGFWMSWHIEELSNIMWLAQQDASGEHSETLTENQIGSLCPFGGYSRSRLPRQWCQCWDLGCRKIADSILPSQRQGAMP